MASSHSFATRSFKQTLEFRRIDQLFRQSAAAPFLIFISVVLFLFIGWQRVPHNFLFVWAGVWLLAAGLRTLLMRKWFKNKELGKRYSMAELHRWSWVIIGGCIISGTCAGFLGAFSRLYLGLEEQLFMGLLILGQISGTLMSYSLSLACGLGFLWPALTIWTAGLIYGNAPWPMVMLLGLSAVVNHFLAKSWHTYAINSLRLNLDLHHNREKLLLAMDSSGAASWTWEPESDLFSCDENIAQVLGVSQTSLRTFRDYLECVDLADRDTVKKAFACSLRTGSIDLEHRIKCKVDNNPRFVALRGKVQANAGTNRISGITWDITNKKNEEAMLFERDLLEKANHAKLMFLANVSHEMRTPLTAIHGFTENLLNDPGLPLRFHEQLSVVLRSSKYLTSVVHDLLDLSKAETDNIYIQKTKIVLPVELNDAIHAVRVALEKKRLDLNVVYETPVPEIVVSDATRVRQILINLLSNSVKYTEHGQIEMRISFERTETSGRLKIVVIDTGIGISNAEARNLFQPFTRGNSIRVRQQSGSGLGLVLSRTLALRLNGDLRLLSTTPKTPTSNGNTAFELTIDVGPCHGVRFLETHPWAPNELSPRPLSSNVLSFKNRRFLIVEDDEDIRWLLQDHLQKKGANVVSCVHGGEAIEKAFLAHFDAVLMDIKMPVMDGYEATSELRHSGFRDPIVALTAHANSSDMLMCYQAGCDFYLSKPIDFENLDEVLKRCLDGAIVATS